MAFSEEGVREMRRPRSGALGLAVLLTVALSAAAPSAASASAPGFVSVLFGRTQWVSVTTIGGRACTRLPNTVTLGTALHAMWHRHIRPVGVVIPTRTPKTGIRCAGFTTYPGWRRLKRWHRRGMNYVSGGSHSDVNRMSYEQRIDETCGSLRAFRRHGLRASGMYAYANNRWSRSAQIDPVKRCFQFGRRYARWRVNVRSTTTSPWFQWTHSVNGGKCNDRSLRCYWSAGAARSHYDSPVRLATMMDQQPNRWFSVQFYRFVTGTYHGGSKWTWDCRGTDWRRHYTSQWELYCYGDFLRVMDALRRRIRRDGVRNAGPKAVGRAWGRTLHIPKKGHLRSTRTRIRCGSSVVGQRTTCWAVVTDTADGIPRAPAGIVRWRSDDGRLGFTRCKLSGVRPATNCSVSFTPRVRGAGIRAHYRGSAVHHASTTYRRLT